ncbi:E3 ubiquitin-protein ligase RNF19A-like isoform X1 [Entelurus aequoreus]|uniref:E3 ubiquitin-protein ligase RNF19A-like isoform X1 n=1 Tax=Entelurus aequoreus TaxID=161455 RepID=UPI002B1D003D|nr:E3 ubiquitin-protein ligase RNF19A-like isoform X1 [Entelurus aequoreus]XP_061904502.1 E3 ubiquitin-protein ligase RNF19A-like isoform X1 [Entelurus aequoreus]XP_061904504.1 E3 ubiquitin-protein ligase RNF19A-like isoform X1 [Entelurus aequoreus]XP_061904505.1 E3 ubiquitin-protein ligase RNF19A-like isoform X1 [Entelurus aequoreus]XP_061904582.1 E3 ubiquitin-protein ligase RNF19A-like isoform X1 [Entelurus aequoreus]
MSTLHQQHHGSAGSERELNSAASSNSLPSVRKTTKKRSISLQAIFGRRRRADREPNCKSKAVPDGSVPDCLVSVDNVPSETSADRTSANSIPGAVSASSVTGSTSELLECPLCLLCHARDRFPDIMTCHHRSCADCLRQYLRIEISESRVNICCPECSERFNPHDISIILADRALMEKYEEFMLRRWLVAEPDCRWCPAPDCGYAVIAFGCASCPKITCGREGCGTEFCYHCKQLWHPNQTCDTARQQRAQHFRLRSFRSSSLSYSQESGAAGDDIKPCPRCAACIIKMNDGSCNHMTCAVCGCEFCWLCMKEISDLHYLSPSGCTFWGKKPWSRKKKILWQLGTLVGAPVGIALIAGIAFPAMIIGIPVYVGRKIHNRYEGKDISKHKRNLVIAGGVTLSVIVSPAVAAVTVGIGVPIMLAYVYGVVPISLCRSGGCGVSAGNGKGVRIEFDDENDNMSGGAAATVKPDPGADTTSVAETRLNNPSLFDGASVGGLTGLSLSVSGSHMERCGVSSAQRDNMSDNVSTTALAGTSITGSLSGSCYNRMEVQADVQKERCSLSGESATVSLGTISDNASTKAMAGSILSAYMPLERDNSVEGQTDVESKEEKVRHCSASSSLDEASCSSSGTTGFKGATAGPSDGHGRPPSPWSKEDPAAACKKNKGKLWKRGKAESKMNHTDAQLLERRSTNSSEFDLPSLSGSLPSVADSHCSHLSSELSCSDPETVRTAHPLCSDTAEPRAAATSVVLGKLAVTPMPEVEHDRLEQLLPHRSHSAFSHCLVSSSPPASPTDSVLFITEEGEGNTANPHDNLSGPTRDTAAQPVSPTSRRCIQTEI